MYEAIIISVNFNTRITSHLRVSAPKGYAHGVGPMGFLGNREASRAWKEV
jgi:hypothetical protein